MLDLAMLRIVKLSIKPESSEAFVSIFRNHRPKLLAFPGCQSLTLVRDFQVKHQFFTISEWLHQSDLEQYRKSTLFIDVWHKVKPMFQAKASVQNLEVLSSDVFKISI